MTLTQHLYCHSSPLILCDTVDRGPWLWDLSQHEAPGSCHEVIGTRGEPSLPGPEGHLLF